MPREVSFKSLSWEVLAERGDVEGILADARRESPGLIIQVFGTSSAPNPAALEMVAAQTLAATKSGSTLAEKPELDLLMRLAGTRQIGEALQVAGYKSGGNRLFMVAASEMGGPALGRLRKVLARDDRFVELPRRELASEDFEQVERAALLASGSRKSA